MQSQYWKSQTQRFMIKFPINRLLPDWIRSELDRHRRLGLPLALCKVMLTIYHNAKSKTMNVNVCTTIFGTQDPNISMPVAIENAKVFRKRLHSLIRFTFMGAGTSTISRIIKHSADLTVESGARSLASQKTVKDRCWLDEGDVLFANPIDEASLCCVPLHQLQWDRILSHWVWWPKVCERMLLAVKFNCKVLICFHEPRRSTANIPAEAKLDRSVGDSEPRKNMSVCRYEDRVDAHSDKEFYTQR